MSEARSLGSASGMVATPWGRADSLRERRLRPGPGKRAEDVAQSQRERLFAAMVASVSERGYGATRVSDLVELSGVSSRTFYDLFADKAACFVAAVEAMLGMAIEYAARTAAPDVGGGGAGSWEERAASDFRAFGEMIASQPAAARMCLIEAYAAGPEALKPLEDAVAGFEALALHGIKESPERADMPAEMITAHVGAVLELARSRLRRGTEAELPALMEGAAELMLSYRPPPEQLRLTTRSSAAATAESLEAPNHAERAIRALGVVLAEKGYANTTVDDVVARAGMSASTFYANFSGKEDVMMAAIDSAGAQIAAAVIPTFERSQDWASAFRAGFGALFGFLATRPALARLMAVEAYAAGVPAMERRTKALAPLGALIQRAPRTLRPPTSPALVFELIAGGVYALVYRQVRDHGVESLPSLAPLCTYIALAPFIGAEGACAAANGDGRTRGPIPESLKAIKVLQTIDARSLNAEEIAAQTGIPQEEVESHLADLQSAKAIQEAGEGRFQVTNLERHGTAAWESLGSEERERISRQVGYLILADVDEAVEGRSFDARPDRHLSRAPVQLDRQGWRELLNAHDVLLDAALEIHEKSAERMKKSGEEAIDGRSVQALFEMPPQTGPPKH